ncbi:hypothetical protein NPIL_646991 [Nephila pilipes]|uniref:Uncharacterized protein n=1 Tax=Nephila pilipes TaxID=299642 RepID=A0A8X6JSL9_NEPPI|nr:hypothetical protein NPIL_646991 [Nephila pilipes]
MPVRPPANGKPRPKSLRLKGEAAEGESGSLACRTLSMFLPPHLLALPQHQYHGKTWNSKNSQNLSFGHYF